MQKLVEDWATVLFLVVPECRRRRLLNQYALLSLSGLFFCWSWVRAQAGFPSLEDYFRQAREFEKREDYAGAEKIYQGAAKNFPNQPEILKRLGIVYQTELKFPESIGAFQGVLNGAPQYPEVNFYLGLSHFGVNQFEKAVQCFDKELEANPKYRRARYYAALALQAMNRNADALRHYEILLQDDPNDARVLYQVIRFHKTNTLQAINRLGNLEADSDFMHALKAENYLDQEKFPEAIQEYKEVLKKNPNFPEIHFAIGEIYWKKIDYQDAEHELRLALREDPNHPKANYYLADILLKSQRVQDAIPLLEIAIAAAPQSMLAHFQLGKCYAAQGKLQDALKVLLKAAELDPNYKSTHYQLAQLYARLHLPEKERYHMEIFRKLYDQDREKDRNRRQKLLEAARTPKN